METINTNTKSQRAKKTSDFKSPKDASQLARQQHFELPGDDAVLSLLRAHISKYVEIQSDGVYAVASSSGLLIVTRELKDGRYLPYNEGKNIGLIPYNTITDVLDEMECTYVNFMAWRKKLADEDAQSSSRTMQELNNMQYHRLNSTLIFYTLVRLMAKTNRHIEVEEFTPFYCGYNSSNIKQGEWFDRSTLAKFDSMAPAPPQSLFRTIELEHDIKVRVITAIANIMNPKHLHKFNMSAARVVFNTHSRSYSTAKYEPFIGNIQLEPIMEPTTPESSIQHRIVASPRNKLIYVQAEQSGEYDGF